MIDGRDRIVTEGNGGSEGADNQEGMGKAGVEISWREGGDMEAEAEG